MFAQLFESFRKASETTLQAQQDLFRQWVQTWPSVPLQANGATGEWSEAVQKRLHESTTEAFDKHRELLDTTYKNGIQLIEQTFKVGQARSPEDYRHLVEQLWSKLSESFKTQSEAQFREFQNATDKWLSLARNEATPNYGSPKA
jgi:hypothetical protein